MRMLYFTSHPIRALLVDITLTQPLLWLGLCFLLYYSAHLPEHDHDGHGGADDDGERDEEAGCEEEDVVAQLLPLAPGRGAAAVAGL